MVLRDANANEMDGASIDKFKAANVGIGKKIDGASQVFGCSPKGRGTYIQGDKIDNPDPLGRAVLTLVYRPHCGPWSAWAACRRDPRLTQLSDDSVTRRAAGKPVDFRDIEIAGIVAARRATLATGNVRHFEGLDIQPVNPWRVGSHPSGDDDDLK
jgi:hypothetical protein